MYSKVNTMVKRLNLGSIRKSKFVLLLLTSPMLPLLSGAQQLNLLPADLNTEAKCFEFSSLTTWVHGEREYIILVPALKNSSQPCNADISKSIYAISSLEITKALTQNKAIDEIIPIPIDPTSYNKFISSISKYDGIEGTVTIEDTIFFCIETSSPLCYVVRGTIKEDRNGGFSIELTKRIPFNKPPSATGNDGFESICYWRNGSLLVAFENEYGNPKKTWAYTIDPALTDTVPYNEFPVIDSNNFNRRLPEFICDTAGELICLSTRERGVPRLVHFKTNGEEEHQPLKIDKLNWEGMTPFKWDKKAGMLLINDNCNCPDGYPGESKLIFYPFN